MRYLLRLFTLLGILSLNVFSLSAQQDREHQHEGDTHAWCGVLDSYNEDELRHLRQANGPYIPNDNKLRIYKLALPVDYNAYTRLFNSSKDEVKQWWRQAEQEMNLIFLRDIGIKFQVVESDNLIITEPEQEKFVEKTSNQILNAAATTLNAMSGVPTYDIALWVAKGTDAGILGLAYVGVAHRGAGAVGMVATKSFNTLGHELGHIFGAKHTHTEGQPIGQSNRTEVFAGHSLMSYRRISGYKNYFSLVSIRSIREYVQTKPAFHNTYLGYSYPQEVISPNQAPQIDRSKLREHYSIPYGSYFSFPIPASDPEGHRLSYAQHMIKPIPEPYPADNPNYYTAPFEYDAPFPYRRVTAENNSYHGFNLNMAKGNYKLCLGVRDEGTSEDFKVQYDSYEVGLDIVEGTAFDILPESNFKTKYKGGETIELKWSVDPNLLANTKVRILLSDDYGQTFKHTLVAETANDGAETITLPTKIDIDKSSNPQWSTQLGLGVIRIEVLDHIIISDSHIGGALRPRFDQRYSFTLEATEDDLPAEVPPIPTAQPVDAKPEGDKVVDKIPTEYQGNNNAIYTANVYSIDTQLIAGVGTIDIVRLAHGVVRVIPKPAHGQRLKSIKVNTPGKPEQDITVTRSFVLRGNTVLNVEFEEAVATQALKVYPNPAVDYITVISAQANTSIYITNLMGERFLLGRTDSEGMAYCHIGSYPTGAYIISVGVSTQTIQIR